ncbi:MAG: type II toxin-antitoxin system VapC family toxin [Candidatus Kapaibacteriales bacterium]
MRLLLDTHAFIWFVDDSPQLGSKIKALIENSASISISIASIWEIGIKRSLNKLDFDVTMEGIFEEIVNLYIALLEISKHNLIELERLPMHHRDPFERLLIAQAISEKMTLVSKDRHFNSYGVNVIW